MKNSRILIIGDSWGQGAWSTEQGLSSRFGDDHLTRIFLRNRMTVDNLSVTSSSLVQIQEILASNLRTENFNHCYILLIQTDPIRSFIDTRFDYRLFDKETTLTQKKQRLEKITSFWERNNIIASLRTEVDRWYWFVDSVACAYNVKVNLVGGFSDVDLILVKNYPNINVVCDSWTKLIAPEHVPSIFANSYGADFLVRSREFQVVDAMLKRQQITERYSGDTFGWYNDSHPSRVGIEILVKHIKERLVLAKKEPEKCCIATKNHI